MHRRLNFPSSQREVANGTAIDPRHPTAMRMIAADRMEQLAACVASPRLHAVDLNGDTPLHVAARMGHLGLCDRFLRAGADHTARNHKHQTPLDIALTEGHLPVARLLYSQVGDSRTGAPRQAPADATHEEIQLGEKRQVVRPVPNESITHDPSNDHTELEDLLPFESEPSIEQIPGHVADQSPSESHLAWVTNSSTELREEEMDQEVDLSPSRIREYRINGGDEVSDYQDHSQNFLTTKNRGRRPIKRSVLPSDTRLRIDFDICLIWADSILRKSWYTSEDIDTLISFCEGNSTRDELRSNMRLTLEAAGIQWFDGVSELGDILWDSRSDVSAQELAEALEATLSRSTCLPGTNRFNLGKSDELRRTSPVIRAKKELQLAILASDLAVQNILHSLEEVLDGTLDPSFVTTKTIFSSRPKHADTAKFIEAFETLRRWRVAGRSLSDRRLQKALEALDTLGLSQMFYQSMVKSMAKNRRHLETSLKLDGLVTAFEGAMDEFLVEHLAYVRRFASRNVEDGEDSEEVFQVAFMGMQRSSHRFDVNRDTKFADYSMFWMKKAISRWRENEGSIIRIPSHRHWDVIDLEQARQRLEAKHGHPPTVEDLRSELEWDETKVNDIMQIPRQRYELDDIEGLQGGVLTPSPEDVLCDAETKRLVLEALASLPGRQADVIRMRFGIDRDDEMTLQEIGQIYGLTRERIRQIVAKGISRLSNSEFMCHL